MAGLSAEKICELTDVFRTLDKDGVGFIKKAGVKDILVSIGKDGTNEEVQNLISEMDADGDGVISCSEFLNVMAKFDYHIEPEPPLRQMFKMIDRDDDGYITHSEMKRALVEMYGEPVSQSEVDGMINEADQDGDKKVDFNEFEAMMKRTYPDQYH